jgi:putative cardiolipin synthase
MANQYKNCTYAVSSLLLLIIAGCTSLPVNPDRKQSNVITGTAETGLGQSVARLTAEKGNTSGFSPLIDGLDAFAARVVLTRSAERSVDVQYYIWHQDEVGSLLAAELIKAAERGVRVRLLIDDVGLGAPDAGLLSVDAHPNIEIRLFNPVVNRGWRMLESAFSFSRINRRMHNKSFTADNQVTIVGGRNVGNEYYDADPDVNFSDFDVLAVGPVVSEVSGSFDKYWNSEFSIPVSEIITATATPIDEVVGNIFDNEKERKNSPYVKAVKDSDFVDHIKNGTLPLFWGEAHVVYDEPEKLQQSSTNKENHLLTKLNPLVGDVQNEIIIISPYFIPGKDGVADIADLIKQGVSIKILTNSLASTDVGVVYGGYSKYRIPLLVAGAELYEAKPDPRIKRKPKKKTKTHFGSSSRSSLHSKVYTFDGEKVFVGSLNLDPRSVDINTEIGILFENKEFAEQISAWWDREITIHAYELNLEIEEIDDDWEVKKVKSLVWLEHTNEGVTRHIVEPQVGFWRRVGVSFLAILPIESQL